MSDHRKKKNWELYLLLVHILSTDASEQNLVTIFWWDSHISMFRLFSQVPQPLQKSPQGNFPPDGRGEINGWTKQLSLFAIDILPVKHVAQQKMQWDCVPRAFLSTYLPHRRFARLSFSQLTNHAENANGTLQGSTITLNAVLDTCPQKAYNFILNMLQFCNVFKKRAMLHFYVNFHKFSF